MRTRLLKTSDVIHLFIYVKRVLLIGANQFLRKHLKCVDGLMSMIQPFPYENPQAEGLLENMQKIRTKFRQVGVDGRKYSF
jgi:hypothetical protein